MVWIDSSVDARKVVSFRVFFCCCTGRLSKDNESCRGIVKARFEALQSPPITIIACVCVCVCFCAIVSCVPPFSFWSFRWFSYVSGESSVDKEVRAGAL